MAKKKLKRAMEAIGAVPGGLYRFVDISSFTQDWSELGWGDDELRLLEDEIGRNPTRPPVVPGGGGARKIRLADRASARGKRGGHRVLYAFLAEYGIVLLVAAWPKSEREDLTPQDYRAIGQVIARIRELLTEGKIR
jgi:mRNA-degrading endonuclease RelE of RelBE toxin-antitoxin system